MTETAAEASTLVLLRHAKSAWPDVPDHERPLAERGRLAAPAMGDWLRIVGYQPDLVLCSTARRARQTWELAQPALRTDPPTVFDRRLYQASAERMLDLIRHTDPSVRTLLVIGHDPAIPELAIALAAASPAVLAPGDRAAPRTVLDRMRAKFPTGAVAVFESSEDWSQLSPGLTRMACFVTPRDLVDQPPGTT
ncbi:MAG TPA: histidine phosphatase family protein [Streptosporangiaceae bacterium]|nr:histidine phosphatase family protein [Streptosporangiaceae bacterium]